MLIETRAIDFPLTEAIRGHVESRLAAALGPLDRWVQHVTVRLEDVNADRGGIDKRCSMVATLPRHGVVVIEAIDEDLYAAIDAAAHRIRRRVIRSVKQRYERQRKDPQRPGSLLAA